MRLILLIALACTASFAAPTSPKYLPLEFSEMAMAANLIVHGEIVVVTKESFELEVEAVLHGELKPESQKSRRISVQRFANWTCASRWHEYAPGQRVVLFLRSQDMDTKLYRIMSAGGEGEMFITAGSSLGTEEQDAIDSRVVSVRGRGTGSLKEVENIRLGLIAQSVQPSRLHQVKLTDLSHAIRELHRCLQITPKRDETGTRQFEMKQLVKEDELAKLAKSSTVAALLVNAARSHIVK